MVRDVFKEEELPGDFSARIKRLLDSAAKRGREHEQAIGRLADLGVAAVEPLCEALGDPRGPVRRAAAYALCKIGDERALKPILRVLYSDTWNAAWGSEELCRSGRVLSIPGVREELYPRGVSMLPQLLGIIFVALILSSVLVTLRELVPAKVSRD